MKPGTYPLELYRGDSYDWVFQLWTDTAKTEPADLTDAVAEAEIRERAGGSTVWTLACAITLPNLIRVSIDAADWEGRRLQKGSWDLQITYDNGAVSTVIAGPVIVTWDVTETLELNPVTP